MTINRTVVHFVRRSFDFKATASVLKISGVTVTKIEVYVTVCMEYGNSVNVHKITKFNLPFIIQTLFSMVQK
jgi:hypothetical protein